MKNTFHRTHKVPDHLKEAFEKHYQYQNYHRLSLFAFFLIFEELGRLFLNIGTITDEHFFLNCVMIGTVTITIPFSFYVKHKYKKDIPRLYGYIIYGIIFLTMMWCVAMTLVEVKEANNMNTLTLGFFAIAALAYLHPWVSFAFYSSAALTFCVFLPDYVMPGIEHDHYIDAVFISTIAFVLSHIIYKLNLEVYLDKIIIEENNKKLFNQSIRDSMTNLFNRKHSLELLSTEINFIKNGKVPPCLLFLDIDYFKQINDNYGHSTGDHALLDVATIIESTIRPGDHAGRYGGEEFIVIFPETHLETAYTLAENIRQNIEHKLKTTDYAITISGGIIQCQDKSVDDNIIEADQLLYKAKELGRNRIVL
jgi:diguanylate cyclase (GGDEF)-like protein